jgi:deazaflavin-dependent oxidoreductase (nitroreductase family)
MSSVKRLSQFVVYLFFLVGQTSFAAIIEEVATVASKDSGGVSQAHDGHKGQGGTFEESHLLRVAQTRAELNDLNQRVITEFRANQGKVGGQYANRPLLLLTTTGAKSGQALTRPLAYTKDGDRFVVIASFGGGPKNPSWYHNLVANPEATVEVGSERFRVRATVATGEERQRLYNRQAEQIPAFAEYQKKTTRQIPVIVLTRID